MLSAQIFHALDPDSTGLLPVEDLVNAAVQHFSTRNTRPPKNWIIATIGKHDADKTGALNSAQLTNALDALRRC